MSVKQVPGEVDGLGVRAVERGPHEVVVLACHEVVADHRILAGCGTVVLVDEVLPLVTLPVKVKVCDVVAEEVAYKRVDDCRFMELVHHVAPVESASVHVLAVLVIHDVIVHVTEVGTRDVFLFKKHFVLDEHLFCLLSHGLRIFFARHEHGVGIDFDDVLLPVRAGERHFGNHELAEVAHGPSYCRVKCRRASRTDTETARECIEHENLVSHVEVRLVFRSSLESLHRKACLHRVLPVLASFRSLEESPVVDDSRIFGLNVEGEDVGNVALLDVVATAFAILYTLVNTLPGEFLLFLVSGRA